MDKYIQIIRDIEPDMRYGYTKDNFISLVEEVQLSSEKINLYLEDGYDFNFNDIFENIRKKWREEQEQQKTKGKGTLNDPEVEGESIYKDFMDAPYDKTTLFSNGLNFHEKHLRLSRMVKEFTAKFKGMYLNLLKRVKGLYASILEKIGKLLSSKGLYSNGATIDYKWTKVDFGKLKSYINEFASPQKMNALHSFVFNFNPTRSSSFLGYSDDEAQYLTVNKYLMIMSSDSPKFYNDRDNDADADDIKKYFSEEQNKISVSRHELQSMFNSGVLDCMNNLYDRVMRNHTNLLKEIDEFTKDYSDLLSDSDRMEKMRLSSDQIRTKIARMNKAIPTCITGNIKFMNTMFNVIIYGMHQQIKATIAAIKSTKFNKENIKQQKLLAAPAI